MRFKIKEERNSKEHIGTIELLGRTAVERFVETKIREALNEIRNDLENLRQQIFNLEEQYKLRYRKEFS